MSDHALEHAVMTALADNAFIDADGIVVQVLDGRATLRGTVGNPFERGEAVRTACDVAGITAVEDELLVKLMGTHSRADAGMEAAILAALIADDQVDAAKIEVEVRGGYVTLSGLVELEPQRDHAERIALGVGGVKQVRNRIVVELRPR
jgi:osmotically-inducible protein OsmY